MTTSGLMTGILGGHAAPALAPDGAAAGPGPARGLGVHPRRVRRTSVESALNLPPVSPAYGPSEVERLHRFACHGRPGLSQAVGAAPELANDHLECPADRDPDERAHEGPQSAGNLPAQRGADQDGNQHPEGVELDRPAHDDRVEYVIL